jgi:hydroxyacylglutathione hydrolase
VTLEVVQLPVLNDNYVYLVHEPVSGAVAVVDPAVADAPLEAAKECGWHITHILNTHHHGDHVGGNLKIKAATGCTIVGPAYDRDRIPGIDVEVKEGDDFKLGEAAADILFVPGHTRGHIAYFFKGDHKLFIGDTLFAMGCGRLFEGTPAQMFDSLGKLKKLPKDTLIYCAHEYTLDNGTFALTVDGDNPDLIARMQEVRQMRAENKPTVPSMLSDELKTNPFLLAASTSTFAEIRAKKDKF